MNVHIPSPDIPAHFLTLPLMSVLKNQFPEERMGLTPGTVQSSRVLSAVSMTDWGAWGLPLEADSCIFSGNSFVNFDDLLLDGYTLRAVTSS